jgi:hypothetical protein
MTERAGLCSSHGRVAYVVAIAMPANYDTDGFFDPKESQ